MAKSDAIPKRLVCSEHRRYMAVREPRKTDRHPSGCHQCWLIWQWAESRRISRLTWKLEQITGGR